MNAYSGLIPTLKAARIPPRRIPLATGQVWHVKMPGEIPLTCVLIDELSPRTVALRRQSDLAVNYTLTEPAVRYARRDIVFVERVPE